MDLIIFWIYGDYALAISRDVIAPESTESANVVIYSGQHPNVVRPLKFATLRDQAINNFNSMKMTEFRPTWIFKIKATARHTSLSQICKNRAKTYVNGADL